MRKSASVVAGALLLGAGAVFMPVQASAPAPPRIDGALKRSLVSAKATDVLPVYVHASTSSVAKTAATSKGMKVLTAYDAVGVAVAAGTPAQIKALGSVKGLQFLEAPRAVEFHMDSAHIATRMDEARSSLAAPNGTGYDGTGITVAVLDSGINGRHPMFVKGGQSKVVRNLKLACGYVAEICAGDTDAGDANDNLFLDVTRTTNDSDTISTGGHGTHVAGTAAGYEVQTSYGRKVSGVATGAKLVGISIGQGVPVYGHEPGLNWILEHHAAPCADVNGDPFSDPVTCPPIKAVNMSFGPSGGGEFDDQALSVKLQRKLVEKGIVLVRSAGNGDANNVGGTGSDVRTHPQGQDPTPGVLMVANYDDADNGTREGALNTSSSRGRYGRPETHPDISAPGTDITSACSPTLAICQVLGGHVAAADPNYGTISGTSMAAPYVAGVVAVMQSANPSMTPAQIEHAIEDTAHRFAFGGPYESDPRNPNSPTSFDKGHGLLDAYRAIGVAVNQAVAAPDAQCTAGSPQIKDPAGDSGAASATGYFAGDPQMDIASGFIAATPDRVTFTVEVDDLAAADPLVSRGFFLNYNFSYKGADYFIRASRGGGVEGFSLRDATGTLATINGSFDAAADRITAVLPAASFPAKMPAPANGDAFRAKDILLYRNTGAAGFATDTAKGYCPVAIVGGGTAGQPATPASALPAPWTRPAPVPVPASEGSISPASPQFTWSGTMTMDAETTFGGCAGWNEGACQSKAVTVDVPAGGATLTVDLIASSLVPSDLDVYLYGPDGHPVGFNSSEGAQLGSTEKIVERVTEPGVYVVQVVGYVAVETGYNASLTLSP